MALSFGNKTQNGTVGLDLDGAFLAAAEASQGRIVRAASVDLEPGAIAEGEVADPGRLSAALRSFFKSNRLPRRVRLGVANQQIVVRQLDLPRIADEADREAAVRFQASEAIAMPLSEAVLDYQVISETAEGEGGPRMRVVVVAAREAMIAKIVEAVRGAGLRPEGIDLNAFALVRALAEPSFPDEGEENAAGPGDAGAQENARVYCHLAGVSNLAVALGSSCVFTRPLSTLPAWTVGRNGDVGGHVGSGGALGADGTLDSGGTTGSGGNGDRGGDLGAGGPLPHDETVRELERPETPPSGEYGRTTEQSKGESPRTPRAGTAELDDHSRNGDGGAGVPQPAHTGPLAPQGYDHLWADDEPTSVPGGGGGTPAFDRPEAVSADRSQTVSADRLEAVSADGPEAVSALAEEIRLSIDFYMSQPEARWVGEVVLSGPGSTLDGLAAELSAAIRLPVSVASPLGRLEVVGLPAAEDPHRLTIAAGLALGAAT